MHHKTLSNGFSLPAVGLGTWKMGGERSADTARDTEWITAITEALRMGYTHIDTAAMYGAGHCEELVGKAIEDFDRGSFSVATKVFPPDLAYGDLLQSFRESRARLGVEYVDLLYVHGPNPEIPLSETLRAMNELVDEGLVINLAVSNFSVAQMREAQEHTEHKIVANQVEYNLATREHGKLSDGMASEVLPFCQEHDMLLVAYRPVDRGAVLESHPLMDELAAKYHKTPAQIAINWLISQEHVVTIPMSSDPAHLRENLEATTFTLDPEDHERLTQEYPHT